MIIGDFIVLSQSEDSQITYCKKCKAFSLAYKSSCASFSAVELDQFKKVLESLGPPDYNCHMMGKAVAIIKNNHCNLGLCLTPEDTDAVIGMIGKSIALF